MQPCVSSMVGQSKGGGAVAEDSHEASSQRAAPLHRGKAALRPSGERDGNPGQKAGQKSGTENGDVGGECGGQIGAGGDGGGGERKRERLTSCFPPRTSSSFMSTWLTRKRTASEPVGRARLSSSTAEPPATRAARRTRIMLEDMRDVLFLP